MKTLVNPKFIISKTLLYSNYIILKVDINTVKLSRPVVNHSHGDDIQNYAENYKKIKGFAICNYPTIFTNRVTG